MGNNYIHHFLWGVINYSCPNINEVKAWMNNYIVLMTCSSSGSKVGLINLSVKRDSALDIYLYYNIWGGMCSTGPFQYRWLKGYIYSSSYYHHQIGCIHLSHCYHIFPWLCAWDVCYIIFCHLLHIRSGKTGNLFSLLLCSLWWVQIVGHILACRSHSFVCTVYHLIIIIAQIYLKTLNL